jgi:hypothetical protein
MHAGGVALKADRLAGCGGVERPVVAAKDGEQGLAALAGEGTMHDRPLVPRWHLVIITHQFEENKITTHMILTSWIYECPFKGCNIAHSRDKNFGCVLSDLSRKYGASHERRHGTA